MSFVFTTWTRFKNFWNLFACFHQKKATIAIAASCNYIIKNWLCKFLIRYHHEYLEFKYYYLWSNCFLKKKTLYNDTLLVRNTIRFAKNKNQNSDGRHDVVAYNRPASKIISVNKCWNFQVGGEVSPFEEESEQH